jgi:hypothetical protein
MNTDGHRSKQTWEKSSMRRVVSIVVTFVWGLAVGLPLGSRLDLPEAWGTWRLILAGLLMLPLLSWVLRQSVKRGGI